MSIKYQVRVRENFEGGHRVWVNWVILGESMLSSVQSNAISTRQASTAVAAGRRSESQAHGMVNATAANEQYPRVQLATLSEMRDSLKSFDLSLMWNAAGKDDPRSSFRPSFDELFGEGSANIMPASAVYLSVPGKNTVYLPSTIDKTLIDYFQRNALLGDYRLVDGVLGLIETAEVSDRKVYAIDDYGQQGEGVTVNTSEAMRIANSKEFVSELSSYSSPEIKTTFDEVTVDDFNKLISKSDTVFVKTCNTECSGRGVYLVKTAAEFEALINQLKATANKNDLSQTVILQPKLTGEEKCFEIFINETGDTSLLSISKQRIAADGKTYAGSTSCEVTPEYLSKIEPVILDFVNNLKNKCPGVYGVAMCDYFEDARKENPFTVIDPGLRPTGNTAAAMVDLMFKDKGQQVHVKNAVPFKMSRPTDFAEVEKKLGKLCVLDEAFKTGFGVLPWGYNNKNGVGMLMLVAPDSSKIDALEARVNELLDGALGEGARVS